MIYIMGHEFSGLTRCAMGGNRARLGGYSSAYYYCLDNQNFGAYTTDIAIPVLRAISWKDSSSVSLRVALLSDPQSDVG